MALAPSGSVGSRDRGLHRRRRAQPDRAQERHPRLHPRGRALRPGGQRPRRPRGRRPGRDRGRPVGVREPGGRAGLEHRPQRRAHRRLARHRLRHHRRPPVRLLDADELQRRGRRVVGAARPRRLGRRRDDVARPDGLEPRLVLRQGARPLPGGHAGDLGGADRGQVGALARGLRRLLVRVAHARRAGDRRGAVREGDRPDRPDEPARRLHLRHGRGGAPRDDAREDGVAPARVRPGREGDGRKLVADRRRRGGAARRVRGRGVAAGADAAGALRLVRARRRRPDAHAPRQPGGVREGAREGRASAGTTSR